MSNNDFTLNPQNLSPINTEPPMTASELRAMLGKVAPHTRVGFAYFNYKTRALDFCEIKRDEICQKVTSDGISSLLLVLLP